jgi:5-methylcytosine-specific restriction endonuclease McrA
LFIVVSLVILYFASCSYFFVKKIIEKIEERSSLYYKFNLQNPRSNKWKSVRNNFLERNSECAVCGKTDNLVVHHKLPFHISPEKELDENNFVVLCENKPVNCHFLFGHLMDWKNYNPNIEEDIETWKKKLETD